MILCITLVVIVCFFIYMIKKRNLFVELYSDVENAKSQVRTAEAKYYDVQDKAIGLAGKAQQNYGNELQKVKSAGGQISSKNLQALGQLYPEFKAEFQDTAILSDKLYEEYRIAQTMLNNAITKYNKAIVVFPQNIVAKIFGFVKEGLIDQENLEESKKLKMTQELDFSEFR